MVVPASAQIQRRATITGNGSADSGKCAIEVVVDGAAEVEINGASATLRNLSGQPPQWRRFECTSPMPANAANIRFQGVDGRGRQQLIRDPRNGGPAVVRIEDPSGGAEGYTFDVIWGGGNITQDRRPQSDGRPQYDARPQNDGRPQYDARPQYDSREGRPQNGGPPPYAGAPAGGRFAADDAIRVCRNDIRERAAQRFGSPYVSFENMRLEDNPGRRDWVVGRFSLRRDRRLHQFACSVDFAAGRVRWSEIDPPGGRFGDADRESPRR